MGAREERERRMANPRVDYCRTRPRKERAHLEFDRLHVKRGSPLFDAYRFCHHRTIMFFVVAPCSVDQVDNVGGPVWCRWSQVLSNEEKDLQGEEDR